MIMGSPHADGKMIGMIVFFAANPDEELTTADIMAKTGVVPNSQYGLLRAYVETGWLAKRSVPPPRGSKGGYNRVTYRAGPLMRTQLGLPLL